MRLLGIGVLALLLVGALIVLGQTGAFDTALNKMSGGDRQRVNDYQLAATRSFDASGSDVFVTQVDTDAPLILSGLPSYANASYLMPADARPVSGIYRLNFSSSVAEGVEGALRVSINGVRRADLLLTEGIRREGVDIELTPADLSASELDIVLSLQGRGEIAECKLDDTIAAVVEVAPTSGVRLSLNGPIETSRDKLALWGNRVPVAWSNSAEPAAGLRSIINASRLSAKGYSPRFVPNGITGDELGALTKEAAPRRASFVPDAYPVPLVSEPSNRGTRTFGRRVSWRYRFAERDMPGEVLPAALDLRMLIGPQASDLRRDLTVTINDRLLFSRRISNDTERLNQSIIIPASAQRGDNTLEITLSATDGSSVRCGDIEQSVAELLPETVLRGGSEKAADALSTLRASLRTGSTVTLTGGKLTSSDAAAASQLLASLNPGALEFASSGARSNIRIAAGDVASAGAGAAPAGEVWVVYSSAQEGREIIARPLSELGASEVPAVALFVTVPRLASAQSQAATTEQ